VKLHLLFKRRRQREQELDEEIRAHLAMDVQERIERGENPDEAEANARREFGNVGLVKEVTRDVWGWRWLETFLQDLRYGLRQLRRNPGFTTIAVLTLALGIGANTAIFSVVEGVLLRPLPFKNPVRLVRIYGSNPQQGYSRMMNSPADIADVRRQNSVFQDVAMFQGSGNTLTGAGEAEQIAGARVSGDFFKVFGVPPLLGRAFLTGENQKSEGREVILSHTLWQRRFASDRKILGKTITLDGEPFRVIGVMPSGFHFPPCEPPFKTELWLPWNEPIVGHGNRDVASVARLKPAVTLAQARTEIDTIAKRLAHSYPSDRGWQLDLVPLLDSIIGPVKRPLLALLAAVGLVLLIATANVASLLLARSTVRRREIAVRAAIGASRLRIVRQLLTESLLVAIVGGILGLVVAFWGIHLLKAIAPQDMPRLGDAGINRLVLLVTFAVSLAVGLLFGIAPATQASKVSLNTALKEGDVTAEGGLGLFGRQRSRSPMVMGQVALSVMLLVGAGLLIESFLRLTSVPLGFNPDHVLTFWVELAGERYKRPERRLKFFEQILDRTRALPGVEFAGFTSFLALNGYATTSYTIAGRPVPPSGQEPESGYKAISPDYFRVMQIRLIEGRYFTADDTAEAPPVVIVNRTFARKVFHTEDPIGKQLHLMWGHEPRRREIIGVVGDARDAAVETTPGPECYVPLPRASVPPGLVFVARTRVEPLSLASAIRRAVSAVDKNQPVSLIQTMRELFSDRVAQPRFRADLMGVFALLALSLTVVGIYGVLNYSVTRRMHEIGVRMALGAEKHDVLWMVLSQGLKLAVIGVAIGIAGALALTRFLTSLLYGVTPTDPLTFIAVSLILMAVALLACYIPARRAAKVDPMVALRYE
jgi:putative ABC transport system permease protein